MQISYKSNPGKVRTLNEDSLLCLRFNARFQEAELEAGLFVVADGMGGHESGEVASHLSIKAFSAHFLSQILDSEDESPDPGEIMRSAIAEANLRVFEKAHGEQTGRNMGTTLVAAFISGPDLFIAHVGDSRCYIINERETKQITKDHSLVQEMVDAGLLTPPAARSHSRKNVIVKAVGYEENIKPDVYHQKLFQGDVILLCSDGLWNLVDDKAISKIVLSSKTPEDACAQLVAAANDAGGDDNVSVILVRPDKLPSWKDVIKADTEIKEAHEIQTDRKARKKFPGIFHYKK